MWVWIAIAFGSFVGPSVIVGFAVARILGTIGRGISEFYETEDWATLPPTRAAKEVREKPPEEVEEPKQANVIRHK